MTTDAAITRRNPTRHAPSFDQRSPDWRERAACLGADTELFFGNEQTNPHTYDEAKRLCAACPVTAECLTDALETGAIHGMRGGIVPSTLAKMKRPKQPNATNTGTPPYGTHRADRRAS